MSTVSGCSSRDSGSTKTTGLLRKDNSHIPLALLFLPLPVCHSAGRGRVGYVAGSVCALTASALLFVELDVRVVVSSINQNTLFMSIVVMLVSCGFMCSRFEW